MSLSPLNRPITLAEFQMTHATTRVERQRRVVAQLALHNYPAERAQAVLANYEGTLQRIREDQGHPRLHFEPAGGLFALSKVALGPVAASHEAPAPVSAEQPLGGPCASDIAGLAKN